MSEYVSRYQNKLYQTNNQFLQIEEKESLELESVDALLLKYFNNQFVASSDVDGVKQYESILAIVPDLKTDTFEFRKNRIILRLTSTVPYTERKMIEMINVLMGIGKWHYVLNENLYELTIFSDYPGISWEKELIILLKTILPCNIWWKISYYKAKWHYVKHYFLNWEDVRLKHGWTWQQVLDLTPPFFESKWLDVKTEFTNWQDVLDTAKDWEALWDLHLEEITHE